MATSSRQPQPLQTQSMSSHFQNGPPAPPSQALILSKIDLLITLTLQTWPALILAVQQGFGSETSSNQHPSGPSPGYRTLSEEKRDWLSGALSTLLSTTPEPHLDEDYVEEFLGNIMAEEFECVVEDGSLGVVSAELLRLRRLALRGNFGAIDRMWEEWQVRERAGGGQRVVGVEGKGKGKGKVEEGSLDGESGEEESESESEEEEWNGIQDDDGDGDVEMEDAYADVEAPELVTTKVHREKMLPEVDEDGFTKVVGRKKR
ncbi:MAG: hypothetical protein MMC33_006623 [Icmadophila ericetorum]|nr:hypothetical protein [Icmadophila ericetorum]